MYIRIKRVSGVLQTVADQLEGVILPLATLEDKVEDPPSALFGKAELKKRGFLVRGIKAAAALDRMGKRKKAAADYCRVHSYLIFTAEEAEKCEEPELVNA